MTTSHCSYSVRHDHTCASKLIPFILVVLVRADWTDTSWHTSPEKFTVKAGDTMVSSIVYTSDNSYTMRITSKATGKTISTPYKIEAKQTTKETTAYFVLEHTPRKCAALSAAGEMSFENIYLEVEYEEVTPAWESEIGQNACNSACVVKDPATLEFTWDTDSTETAVWSH